MKMSVFNFFFITVHVGGIGKIVEIHDSKLLGGESSIQVYIMKVTGYWRN